MVDPPEWLSPMIIYGDTAAIALDVQFEDGRVVHQAVIGGNGQTTRRWAIWMLPVLAAVRLRRKRPVGRSWRMHETYIKVAGQLKYLYRAIDKAGASVVFFRVPSAITPRSAHSLSGPSP